MTFEEFEKLVNECEQAKQEYIECEKIASFRQDDEYSAKAIGLYHIYNFLCEKIEREIALTQDERIKNYFPDENDITIS